MTTMGGLSSAPPIAFRALPIFGVSIRLGVLFEDLKSELSEFCFSGSQFQNSLHFFFGAKRYFAEIMPAAVIVFIVDQNFYLSPATGAGFFEPFDDFFFYHIFSIFELFKIYE